MEILFRWFVTYLGILLLLSPLFLVPHSLSSNVSASPPKIASLFLQEDTGFDETTITYDRCRIVVNDGVGLIISLVNVGVFLKNSSTEETWGNFYDVRLEFKNIPGAGPFNSAYVITNITPASWNLAPSFSGSLLRLSQTQITPKTPQGFSLSLNRLGIVTKDPKTGNPVTVYYKVDMDLGPIPNTPPFNLGFIITSLDPSPPPAKVRVFPAFVQTIVGDKVVFKAELDKPLNPKVRWSVDGVDGGNDELGRIIPTPVDETVAIYTAPTTPPPSEHQGHLHGRSISV